MTRRRLNPLIEVHPGLMIWTLVCFGLTFCVLSGSRSGRSRRPSTSGASRIRHSIAEADKARDEARRLLEEHRS